VAGCVCTLLLFLSTNSYKKEESTNYHKGTQIILLSQRGTKNENDNENYCHPDGIANANAKPNANKAFVIAFV
jgi:hypothetical protein